jgi:hypothetical protein
LKAESFRRLLGNQASATHTILLALSDLFFQKLPLVARERIIVRAKQPRSDSTGLRAQESVAPLRGTVRTSLLAFHRQIDQ